MLHSDLCEIARPIKMRGSEKNTRSMVPQSPTFDSYWETSASEYPGGLSGGEICIPPVGMIPESCMESSVMA